MIRLEQVTAAYGNRIVLEPLSLTIAKGETWVLVGPNSAGKSTLLKTMGGLLRLASGSVWLENRRLSDWSLQDRARCVAWVPSEADFTFNYSVEELVLLGRTPYWDDHQAATVADQKIVQRMLELTDLSTLGPRSIDTLSSGERQRVLLARALAQEPALLLLDEPTAHLDLGHSEAFFRALTRLRQLRPLTVVLATHDLGLARRIGEQVVLLKEGRVCAIGAPAEVLTDAIIQTVFQLHHDY